MVLQRAPKRAVVWGFSAPGSQVHVTLDHNAVLSSVTDVNGTWRQSLPPMATSAGGAAHTIKVSNGSATSTLVDVVFGEVFLCGVSGF